MTKSEAGYSFGMILLTAGSAGVMFGAWMARKLSDRGYKDANIRTIFITSLLALPLTVAAPITGDSQMTLLILWPGVMMGSSYLGVMAVAIVVITPNQMRGQITAVYIFVTNILGMAIGTSVLAAFTDFLYQDDGLLHYSIATANGLFYPVAAVLFWYCLAAYRVSFEEAGQWQVE
jgi:MFS family permease